MTGTTVAVKPVRLFVAGFMCDNWCSLNRDRSLHSGNIEKNLGSSGTSANGCLDFIGTHTPSIVVFENVKGIAAPPRVPGRLSDLDFLRSALGHMGYRMVDLRVKAEDFGSCQHRDRLYMVAMRDDNDVVLRDFMSRVGPTDPLADVPVPSWAPALQMTLSTMRLPEQMPLKCFLLPDDHPEVKRCIEERRSLKTQKVTSATTPGGKSKAKPKGKTDPKAGSAAQAEFEAKHFDAFQTVGLVWPPAFDENIAITARVEHLPERQMEKAFYHMKVCKCQQLGTIWRCRAPRRTSGPFPFADGFCFCFWGFPLALAGGNPEKNKGTPTENQNRPAGAQKFTERLRSRQVTPTSPSDVLYVKVFGERLLPDKSAVYLEEVVVDLHPSLDQGSQSYDRICPCLIGSCRPFILPRGRDLCGFSCDSQQSGSATCGSVGFCLHASCR